VREPSPNLAPKTYEKYELFCRVYLSPGLGSRRLDRLEVRDIRTVLNGLRKICQCCAQGKDTARPAAKRRCCAIGQCCRQQLSERTIRDLRGTLRAALGNAVAEELVTRNVAAVVRLPAPRNSRRSWWTVDEARAFLESARSDQDPLYAACALVLVLACAVVKRSGSPGPASISLRVSCTSAGRCSALVHGRCPADPGP
jgi:integrase